MDEKTILKVDSIFTIFCRVLLCIVLLSLAIFFVTEYLIKKRKRKSNEKTRSLEVVAESKNDKEFFNLFKRFFTTDWKMLSKKYPYFALVIQINLDSLLKIDENTGFLFHENYEIIKHLILEQHFSHEKFVFVLQAYLRSLVLEQEFDFDKYQRIAFAQKDVSMHIESDDLEKTGNLALEVLLSKSKKEIVKIGSDLMVQKITVVEESTQQTPSIHGEKYSVSDRKSKKTKTDFSERPL